MQAGKPAGPARRSPPFPSAGQPEPRAPIETPPPAGLSTQFSQLTFSPPSPTSWPHLPAVLNFCSNIFSFRSSSFPIHCYVSSLFHFIFFFPASSLPTLPPSAPHSPASPSSAATFCHHLFSCASPPPPVACCDFPFPQAPGLSLTSAPLLG